jgi:hypothetical protein
MSSSTPNNTTTTTTTTSKSFRLSDLLTRSSGEIGLPYDAVEQYLCQVENQLDLARELDNCILYSDSSAVLRAVHEKLKELMILSDVTLLEWQRRGTGLPETIVKTNKEDGEEGNSNNNNSSSSNTSNSKTNQNVQKWARWTTEEDLALEEEVNAQLQRDQEKPFNMKAIAAKVGTKTAGQCRERVRRLIKAKGGRAAAAASAIAATTTNSS